MAEAAVAATRDYVESFLAEDGPLLAARAAELGCRPVGPAAGAVLRFLAAVLDARAVVEVGTGTGVSGLCLLRGMRADGVLTTVDPEPEHSRAAREAFVRPLPSSISLPQRPPPTLTPDQQSPGGVPEAGVRGGDLP